MTPQIDYRMRAEFLTKDSLSKLKLDDKTLKILAAIGDHQVALNDAIAAIDLAHRALIEKLELIVNDGKPFISH